MSVITKTMNEFKTDSALHLEMLDNKMATELKKASTMLKGSIYEGKDSKTQGGGGNGSMMSDDIQNLINRKIDKSDLLEVVKLKTNKNDTQSIIN